MMKKGTPGLPRTVDISALFLRPLAVVDRDPPECAFFILTSGF